MAPGWRQHGRIERAKSRCMRTVLKSEVRLSFQTLNQALSIQARAKFGLTASAHR